MQSVDMKKPPKMLFLTCAAKPEIESTRWNCTPIQPRYLLVTMVLWYSLESVTNTQQLDNVVKMFETKKTEMRTIKVLCHVAVMVRYFLKGLFLQHKCSTQTNTCHQTRSLRTFEFFFGKFVLAILGRHSRGSVETTLPIFINPIFKHIAQLFP